MDRVAAGNETLALFGGRKAVSGSLEVWPPIGTEEHEAVLGLLKRGELSYYGREGAVRELEDAFADYNDVRYSLALSSGTAAIHSALVACGIGPGDEVIAPTHTFLATVTPILATNGTPKLVDCEIDNEGIDPRLVEEAISTNTKAIIVTHLWGHPVDMDEIMKVAKKHRLRVIEDCSHAHGALYRGSKVGTIGDVGCFSLQGKKIIAAGQGGLLLTNDRDLYERAVLFGHFNVRSQQCVQNPILQKFADTGYGLNYRMHPFAAGLALVQLPKLNERIAMRTSRLNELSRKLNEVPGVSPPTTRDDCTRGAYYGYKPRYVAEEVQELPIALYIKALQAEGLQIHRPGSKPLHTTALFQGKLGGLANFCNSRAESRTIYRLGDFPVSERISGLALSLPTFTYEPYSLIDQYVHGFRKVAAQASDLMSYWRQRPGDTHDG